MPLWLTPRVRQGVTASVIVLILSVFLLTPGETTDAVTLMPQTSSAALNDPVADDYPSHYKPYIPTLPTVTDWQQFPATTSVGRAIILDRGLDDATVEEERPDSAPTPDWFAENLLAAQGILLSSTVCLDCEPPGLLAGLSLPVSGIPQGGGLGGDGGGGGGDIAMPDDDKFRTNPGASVGGSGSSESDTVTPPKPGNLVTLTEPGTPGSEPPGPNPPEIEQVPEPSSVFLAVACALGFTVRRRLAANRRG
jgi:hypothetical protein